MVKGFTAVGYESWSQLDSTLPLPEFNGVFEIFFSDRLGLIIQQSSVAGLTIQIHALPAEITREMHYSYQTTPYNLGVTVGAATDRLGQSDERLHAQTFRSFQS